MKFLVLSMLVSLIFTIAIEGIVLWFFTRNSFQPKKDFLMTVLVNIMTNLPASFAAYVLSYYFWDVSWILLQLPIEAVVFAVEIMIYRKLAKELLFGVNYPAGYAITANLISWGCGIAYEIVKLL